MNDKISCPIEGYSITGFLGDGGNGDVYLVTSDIGEQKFALKILRKVQESTYNRFKIEVDFLKSNAIDGVMPLLDFYLPENAKKEKAWYLMPLAESLKEVVEKKDSLSIISDFIPLTETIIELHDKNISHRDIKPDNLLYLNNRIFLADFGLVKYPERIELTPDKRDVGAKFTMAPEMRRIANNSDGLPADIYSLAKSVWMSLTKNHLGFDGQYSTKSNIGLSNYIKDLYLPPLDDLLVRSTDNDPHQRPTAREFKMGLEEWININNNFIQRNLTEWFEIQNLLFPYSTPNSVEWTKNDEIIKILNLIAERKSLNHMFYPSGGGNDLVRVEQASEKGFIALIPYERCAEILMPKKLSFESFGHDPEWNYFRLECEIIEPTEIPGPISSSAMEEYMIEITPGNYIPPDYWDVYEYKGQPLPETARIISRYIKGSFVFFCKSSTYNRIGLTYDAWQNVGEEEFRKLIADFAQCASRRRPIN
ncbi:protein kinase domain-containing protein [Serratia nevei]|uniref:protein kinase domain-containing protein n=1 Tax=Serratia nevei TaxID=2703794 RepID=UPI003FA6B92A